MAGKRHVYTTRVEWVGNRGSGTSGYRDYDRAHEIWAGPIKPPIAGSSDPGLNGDPARWNPEELLVASLSACHKLWYLHLASVAGVIVAVYVDEAEGVMVEDADGGGHFERVVLRPRVTLSAGDETKAQALHHEAHEKCFIARSVNFPVECQPQVETKP